MKVECLVFQKRIMLSFDDPEILRAGLSKATLGVLGRFNKISEYHYLIELRLLN